MTSDTLFGERVTLTLPRETDVDRVASLCEDPAVQRWTTVPSPYTREDAEHFILDVVPAGWATGTTLTWAIRLGRDDHLNGMIGLHDIAGASAEIGYWLSPEARGQGIMAESVQLVCDYGFAPGDAGLGLQRITWQAFVGNIPSAKVAQNSGFTFEGMRRLGAVQRGRRLDDWSASLLAGDPRLPAQGWPVETLR